MAQYVKLKFLNRSEGRDPWQNMRTGQIEYFPSGINPNHKPAPDPEPAFKPEKQPPPKTPLKPPVKK